MGRVHEELIFEEIFSEKNNTKIRVFEVISLYISYTVRESYSQTLLMGFLTRKTYV